MKSQTGGRSSATRANTGTKSATTGWRSPWYSTSGPRGAMWMPEARKSRNSVGSITASKWILPASALSHTAARSTPSVAGPRFRRSYYYLLGQLFCQ